MDKLIVSSSPHITGNATTRKIMLDVILALMPACIVSVFIFGPISVAILAVSVTAAVLAEFICRKVMKRDNTIGDLSAAVTGLLIGMNMPASVQALWMAPLGSVIAIVVVKQMFGGLGMNFVNPAIAARTVLIISFASYMSTWPAPFAWMGNSADALTTPTPLTNEITPDLKAMLVGARGGCLGETCAIALLIGGIYLVIKKVITPLIPLTYIGTTVLLGWLFGADPLYQLLSGGLVLGAIFMATDYVTTPTTRRGKFTFAVGCGIITALIRNFGNLPEGVSFAIILMNILTPHIDNLFVRHPFGAHEKGAQ